MDAIITVSQTQISKQHMLSAGSGICGKSMMARLGAIPRPVLPDHHLQKALATLRPSAREGADAAKVSPVTPTPKAFRFKHLPAIREGDTVSLSSTAVQRT